MTFNFPTMLRKMWSGQEVQEWLDANVNNQPIKTGLCDSQGKEIHIGDIVRRFSDFNVEVHGTYVDYTVVQVGIVPILSYLISEKGQVLPKGYTAQPLSDLYGTKNLVFAEDSMELEPYEDEIIIQGR